MRAIKEDTPYKIVTLTYDLQGGTDPTGSFSPVTVSSGTKITIPSTKPVKAGYDFKGWSGYAGGEVQYNDIRNKITIYENKTLYAVYEKGKDWTITYNANGGSNAPSPQIASSDSDITISSSTPTWDGHVFQGWSKSQSGSVEYNPGDVCSERSSITLYAIWKTISYCTITYDANGGSGAPSSIQVEVGKQIQLSSQEPSRNNYNFLGWSTSRYSSYADYQPGAYYTPTGNITFYAVWEEIPYCTVNYDGNGDNVYNVPDSQTFRVGTQFTIPSQTPTRDGFDFLGWSENRGSSSAQYQPNDNCIAKNMTLYAVWKEVPKKTFTITYNKNTTDSVTGMPTIQIKTEGIGISLSKDIPVRDGYVFVHWSESSNDSGNSYNPGDLYTKDNNVTLYAIWKQEHKNMHIGSSSVSSIYIGSDKIDAMYIGTTKIW